MIETMPPLHPTELRIQAFSSTKSGTEFRGPAFWIDSSTESRPPPTQNWAWKQAPLCTKLSSVFRSSSSTKSGTEYRPAFWIDSSTEPRPPLDLKLLLNASSDNELGMKKASSAPNCSESRPSNIGLHVAMTQVLNQGLLLTWYIGAESRPPETLN